MDEIEKTPAFYFHYTGSDGKDVSMRFEAETWTEALSNFVQFLQGAGYILQHNSVGINSKNHIIDPDHTAFITTFQQ